MENVAVGLRPDASVLADAAAAQPQAGTKEGGEWEQRFAPQRFLLPPGQVVKTGSFHSTSEVFCCRGLCVLTGVRGYTATVPLQESAECW